MSLQTWTRHLTIFKRGRRKHATRGILPWLEVEGVEGKWLFSTAGHCCENVQRDVVLRMWHHFRKNASYPPFFHCWQDWSLLIYFIFMFSLCWIQIDTFVWEGSIGLPAPLSPCLCQTGLKKRASEKERERELRLMLYWLWTLEWEWNSVLKDLSRKRLLLGHTDSLSH